MKIYVSHKRGMVNQEQFYSIFDERFILPHKNSDESYKSKELFQSHGCDLILAEVSEPSTGQGIELGWANAYGIKIICISREGSKPAKSLGVITEVHQIYKNLNELAQNLERILLL